ncbi:uncharacterized protein LOC143069436 [Mytilus galloprovincialis]|uniref:uncharacterized protein LOC143069436 n=1 Tax=Mytilus galloprovincialis TaxID=29158 RepID=UPI003F7BF3B9
MSEEYKVGSLSDVIKKSSKAKKRKSSEGEIAKLASLFAAPAKRFEPEPISYVSIKIKTPGTATVTKNKEKKSHKKRKTGLDISVPTQNKEGFDPPPGIVHESLLQNTSDRTGEGQSEGTNLVGRKPRHKKRDKTKDARTVFVGNLPLSFDKKQLIKIFRSCGKIESVRFRCPPPADLKLPKRAIAITKTFHKDRHNIISYVCFEEEDSAGRALLLNGQEIDGNHIRVDISNNSKRHDDANTVFIGNMTYDITENEVWKHFEDCGEIENVRIIRDNKTGTGKGIGYIEFKENDGVMFALKFHESQLKGRKLRVMRCDVKAAQKQKEKMIISKERKAYKPGPKPVRDNTKLSFRSTNKKTDPFQHLSDRKNKHVKKSSKQNHFRFDEKTKGQPKGNKTFNTKDKKTKSKKMNK